MRTITPWIDRVLLTAVQDYPTTLPAPPEEKIAIVNAVYDVRKVRISDGEQVARGYFTEKILGKLFERFGSAYDVELLKYYVSVRASPTLIEVNGRKHWLIKIDRLALLEEMPKTEEMPEALSCYLRSNGKKDEDKDHTPISTPPPEIITFKSDAMNLIKRAVTNLAAPPTPTLQPELIDRMKSRIGAALTSPLRPEALGDDAGPRGSPSSKNDSAFDSLTPTKRTSESPEGSAKRLRSSAESRKTSLRSGRSYEKGGDGGTPNSRKRKRDGSLEKPTSAKKAGSRVSVGTEPGTSGAAFGKTSADEDDDDHEDAKRSRRALFAKQKSSPVKEKSGEGAADLNSSGPGKNAALPVVKSEPKEDEGAKSVRRQGEPPASGGEKSSPVVQQPPRGSRRGASAGVCQPSSAWDISPPLLEIMKNFVHKHFAMWN